MNDLQYEKFLNIKTTSSQQGFYESIHHNRYEATSYSALDILFKNILLTSEDCLIDFGCGKGRLSFYLNYNFNCKVKGIEMNSNYIDDCIKNKNNFLKSFNRQKNKLLFFNEYAEKYIISNEDNKFYFFNPFSTQIFIKVMNNIMLSLENFYRSIDIILYYPSDDYIYYLENYTGFTLSDEIKLTDISPFDPRNKFVIYSI